MLKTTNSTVSASSIAALTSASTPLAGTEVLPIVQSGSTVKVSVANLTAGRAISATAVTASTGNLIVSTSGKGVTTDSAIPLGFGTNTTTAAMTIATSGNVGIGTSSPGAPLTVYTNSVATLNVDIQNATASGQGDTYLRIFKAVDGNSNGIQLYTGSTQKWAIGTGISAIDDNYKVFNPAVGIALSVNSASNIITMPAYGAGAATFNGSGVISSVSDENWKRKDGVPSNPTEMLGKLQPGYWYYNDKYKDTFGVDRQLGFYAQNVNAAIGPEAAPEPEFFKVKDEQGVETLQQKPWGYYDRSVLAVVVMALQEALATVKSLEVRIQALEAK